MSAEPVGVDPAEDDRPVVVPLRYGLCAVYVLKPPPRPLCRERPPEPAPWPPDEDELPW